MTPLYLAWKIFSYCVIIIVTSVIHMLDMLGFIILPCPNCSMRLYLPKLEFIQLLLGPLVPLGPLGIMGPPILVTRVWGTYIEVKYN